MEKNLRDFAVFPAKGILASSMLTFKNVNLDISWVNYTTKRFKLSYDEKLFLIFCSLITAQPAPGDPQKSSSHFHCLKCDYYCTDTNKVVAHRRQHQKLDSIMAAGFEKYTPTQYCNIEGCQHNGKQTHYHCGKCQYSVLGLSQMEAHKYRHMNE